jgi:hypothetical protein
MLLFIDALHIGFKKNIQQVTLAQLLELISAI